MKPKKFKVLISEIPVFHHECSVASKCPYVQISISNGTVYIQAV